MGVLINGMTRRYLRNSWAFGIWSSNFRNYVVTILMERGKYLCCNNKMLWSLLPDTRLPRLSIWTSTSFRSRERPVQGRSKSSAAGPAWPCQLCSCNPRSWSSGRWGSGWPCWTAFGGMWSGWSRPCTWGRTRSWGCPRTRPPSRSSRFVSSNQLDLDMRKNPTIQS